jgi:ABC-2 type transport system permease protein
MSWEAIARKDFEDAVRSRWLLGLTVLFTLLVSAVVYITRPSPGSTATSNAVLNSVIIKSAFVTTLIPLIALVISYGAVVGERESGSIKLLLSLPHSRADVVVGKVVGRSAALVAPVVAGFLLPAIVLVVGPFEFLAGSYLGYTLLAATLGAVFVSIAVGFSAAMPSQRLAMVGAIALYFLFVPLWGAIQLSLRLILLLGGTPGWLPLTGQQVFTALRLVNPTGAYKIVTSAFMAGELFTGGGIPLRLEVAAVVVLACWFLLPLLVGIRQFERADL